MPDSAEQVMRQSKKITLEYASVYTEEIENMEEKRLKANSQKHGERET